MLLFTIKVDDDIYHGSHPRTFVPDNYIVPKHLRTFVP